MNRKNSNTEKERIQNIVASYSRISTDSQTQESSLEHQLGYFKNEAEAKGFKYYRSYYDEGVSGTKLSRAGFDKMLHDAGIDIIKEKDTRDFKIKTKYYISKTREPRFCQIWLKSTSRFARNTLSFELIDILRQNGVYIVFLEQGINTKDRSRDFELKLFQTFDEQESRTKSYATKWGYERAAEQEKIYGCPLGYERKDGHLIKNKYADTVALIFKLYTEDGLGIRRIRNYLHEAGIKPHGGGEFFGYSSIKNILKNEKYAGFGNTLKHETGEFMHKHYSKVKPDYKIFKTDKIEQIITEETYKKAQEITKSRVVSLNNKAAGRMKSAAKYSCFIICDICGAFYTRNSDWIDKKDHKKGRYFFYNCGRKRSEGVKACNSLNIKEEDVDKYLTKAEKDKEEIRKQCNILYASLCIEYMAKILKRIREKLHKIDDIMDITADALIQQKAEAIRAKIEHPEQNKRGELDALIAEYERKIEEIEQKERWENISDAFLDVLELKCVFFEIVEDTTTNEKKDITNIVIMTSPDKTKRERVILLPILKQGTELLRILNKHKDEDEVIDITPRHNTKQEEKYIFEKLKKSFNTYILTEIEHIEKHYSEKLQM